MSTVVAFPRDRIPAEARLARGPAQILIFTGVRYERLDHLPPVQPPKLRPGPPVGRVEMPRLG